MSQADFFLYFFIIIKKKTHSCTFFYNTELPVNNKCISLLQHFLIKMYFPSPVHWKSLWPSVSWSGCALHPSGSKARALCLCPFTSPPAAIISILLQPGRAAQTQHTNMHHQEIFFKAEPFDFVNNVSTKRLKQYLCIYPYESCKDVRILFRHQETQWLREVPLKANFHISSPGSIIYLFVFDVLMRSGGGAHYRTAAVLLLCSLDVNVWTDGLADRSLGGTADHQQHKQPPPSNLSVLDSFSQERNLDKMLELLLLSHKLCSKP